MAIMTPGPTVGQISGRIGGIVYSRNRGGMYIRNGAIPTKVTSTYAEQAKARLQYWSQQYAALTSAQRESWKTWAITNPVTNRLGNKITLSGHAAFVRLNVNIALCSGTAIVDPPISAPPAGLATMTASYDIGAGDFQIAYTATPLGADECLCVEAVVTDNPGVNYVNNLFKLIQVSAAAQVSPLDTQTNMALRWGTLIVGQQVFYRVYVMSDATGLRSAPSIARGTIVTT